MRALERLGSVRRGARAVAIAFAVGGLVALALGLAATRAIAAPVLELHGMPVERGARAALEGALRAPGDSLALAEGLGRVLTVLQESGYWDARAHGAWSGERLAVTVEPGLRYRLTAIALRATPAADSIRIAAALELAPGGWAAPSAIGLAIERAVERLVAEGYAYAEIGIRDWSSDSTGARVTLAAVLGPRVEVAEVRIAGLHVTRPDVASRAMGRLEGSTFQPEVATQAADRLAQLGLFRSARYEGLEAIEPGKGRLLYRVDEERYNRFEGVVGSQGDAGTVGTAHLELGNLLGTGRAVGLQWEALGRGVNTLGARYVEPLVLGLPLRLEGALDQEVRDTSYTRTRWGGRAHWTLNAADGISFGFEEERVVQEGVEVEEARLENTAFGLERVAFDDRWDPRRGLRTRIDGTQTFKRERLRPAGSRSARASTVESVIEWLRPAGRSSGIALELRGAARFSSEPVLAAFERFPLGGAASLRGFDEEAFRVDRFALSRLEWRWFLGTTGQRVYAFWDHAWAATRLRGIDGVARWDDFHANGLGFGLRIETGAGLAGIDYGLEPGRAPLDGKIHLRLVSRF